jgi:hypothetical protein
MVKEAFLRYLSKRKNEKSAGYEKRGNSLPIPKQLLKNPISSLLKRFSVQEDQSH